MIIDLTKPDKLPCELYERLKRIESLCRGFEFSEKLVTHRDVRSLVKDINSFCMTQKIIGIHYTRANPKNILENGLLVRSGDKIRALFLKEYGHLFTEQELIIVQKHWENYFNSQQMAARDSRVFFNFTEMALNTHGAKYLLGLYGGEQVAMGFELDDKIGKKLGNIGFPLLVRCALDPNAVRTFTEHPWGEIMVSAYHLTVRGEAYGIDQDGYQTIPVDPIDIVEITVLDNNNVQI